MTKKLPLTEEEIKTQMALGTLPPEMKIDPCRYASTTISRGRRKCFICGEKCIGKGDEYYSVEVGGNSRQWQFAQLNICMDCAWLPMTTIKRMINERKPNKGGLK